MSVIGCNEVKETKATAVKPSYKPEWFGKTDKEVIERFGNPTFVYLDTLNGKKFQYLKSGNYTYDSISFIKNNKKEIDKLMVFYFDSTNTVYNSKFINGTNELTNQGYLFKVKY